MTCLMQSCEVGHRALLPVWGMCFHHPFSDGDSRDFYEMATSKGQLNAKAWGLWITPQKEDVQHGKQHVNTRVESSSSKGHNNVTLIKFTAEVTMGADLYAEWAKDGKFNMPVEWMQVGSEQDALPHTTKYLNPGEEA